MTDSPDNDDDSDSGADAAADSESSGRSLLDEQGRLFGLVNIVDVLVVLLVLAVVVAGAALLVSGTGESETRYATVDFGTQSDFVAEQIAPGDTFEPEGTSDDLRITDVYRFDGGEETRVIARVAVNGTQIEPDEPDDPPIFEFRGEPLLLGQTIPFQTTEYDIEGEITRVERTGTDLPTGQSMFVLETAVSPETAAEIAVGDEFTVAGDTAAAITHLEAFPRPDGDRQLLIGISARTIERGGSQFFGDSRVQVGSDFAFVGDGYDVSGEIVQRGTDELSREDAAVFAQTTVPASTAETMSVGDEFRIGDESVGTISSLELYPGPSADDRTALLGLDLKVNERQGIQRFAGQSIRLGNEIPFETDAYTFSASILQRGDTTIETEMRPFVIETTVPATLADDIRAGDQFRLAGEPIVDVESVTIYATDNPEQRRAILGVRAATREDDGQILFGERQLRLGDSLPLVTDEYDITGEIIRRGSLEESGEAATRTLTIGVDNLRPERAALVREGLVEQTRGETTASVESVTSSPAEIVLESDDGDIFLREHPQNRDLELTVEAQVRVLDDGTLRFRGESLRSGETITLDFDSLRVSGELFDIEE